MRIKQVGKLYHERTGQVPIGTKVEVSFQICRAKDDELLVDNLLLDRIAIPGKHEVFVTLGILWKIRIAGGKDGFDWIIDSAPEELPKPGLWG